MVHMYMYVRTATPLWLENSRQKYGTPTPTLLLLFWACNMLKVHLAKLRKSMSNIVNFSLSSDLALLW